jgi:deoxyribonuclease-4
MGNALHYTQIKKSDLKFEPFAEYLAEEGDWLDITIISDSPLLEHDAMYMLQHYDKARQRLLEIRARDERRLKLAREQGMSSDEIAELERQAAEAKEKLESEKPEEVEKPTNKKTAPKKKTDSSTMMSFEDSDDDDDLF